ncbi:glycine-rich domain-containing protein [Kribbella sp. WER1]
MTISIPQWVNDPGDNTLLYDAAALRSMDTLYAFYDGAVLGGRTGVRPGGTGMQVTFTGSTWMIAPGIAAITAVSSGAFGEYRFAVTATESGAIPAPDATNPRKDILVLQLQDKDNGDAQSRVYARYLAGSPNATPTAPATPAKSLLLATFTVPTSGSTSMVDERVYTVASGGILPSKTRPAAPALGATIYNTTSGIVEAWNGTTWVPLSRGNAVTQTFAANGTWTKPSGAQYVEVEVVGGGGAGGGANASTAGQHSMGSGGGAGGYSFKRFNASDLGSTVPVTVGAGGAGVVGANGNGGGASSFASATAVVANGGGGGLYEAQSASSYGNTGGASGTASGGDRSISGGGGAGGFGAAAFAIGGAGGDSFFGGGGRGVGGGGNGAAVAGADGGAYGAGGGGAQSSNGKGSVAGGAGGPGRVFVTTYF